MNNRINAEHTAVSLNNLFVMQWIVSLPGSGTIKFYLAGNNVNFNNASSGDQVAVASGGLAITENFEPSIYILLARRFYYI